MDNLETSVEKFKALMSQQLERVNQIKRDSEWVDLSEKESIVIGVCWGDGIGESISNQAQRVMEYVLGDAIQQRKVEIRIIDGLTIENRVQHNKAIPDDVLAELRACDVILKGPS